LNSKKKILIVIDWFYPGYKAGGPIQSCRNICLAIGDEYDIHVLTTDTDHGAKEPYPNIQAGAWIFNEELKCRINYLPKKKLSFRLVISEMLHIDADFVYLNHLFSPYFVIAPLFYRFFNKNNAQWIVCPRGALFPSAISHKRNKKKPVMWLYRIFRLSSKVIFHATGADEALAIEKYFANPVTRLAGNIPELKQPPFQGIEKNARELRCLFIARIVPIKNLRFLLQALALVENSCNIRLTIIGPKEDSAYWQSCLGLIGQLPAHIQVSDLGALPAQELSSHLHASHLYVLPTQGENFGHSIFNALHYGRPVLISDRTPWRNLEEKQAGWDLPLNQPVLFTRVIQLLAKYDQAQYDLLAMGAWRLAGEYVQSSGWKQEYKNLFS
jgi:glycosyltransferase involved in cell wall biosynthesis